MLIDIHGRVATDLRVPLTDVGEQPAPHVPHAGRGCGWRARPDLFTDDEAVGLVRIAVIRLGVEEVRLTGGEPLPRPGLVGIVERCVALASRPALCMALTRRDRRHDVLQGPAELAPPAHPRESDLRGALRSGTPDEEIAGLEPRDAGEEGRLRPRRAVFPPARRADVGHRRLTPRAWSATTSTDRTRSEAMGRVTERRRVVRVRDGAVSTRPDTLVAEEPLEIRLGGKPLAITMRTPGDDFALAAGFLVSEGVVSRADDVANIVYCAGATDDGSNTYNVVDVHLAPGVPLPDITLERNVYTTSSCGLCGKASLDAVRTTTRWPIADTPPVRVTPVLLAALPDQLRAAQRVFDRTGGLHAAGLFSPEGELVDLREDVGRHNAVDKLIGRALRSGRLPLSRSILLVSGRASFELAQKAVMAGIPVLAAVSAPSSLAVDLATETGLTLVGFLRGGSMNVYAGEQRLDLYAGVPDGGPTR